MPAPLVSNDQALAFIQDATDDPVLFPLYVAGACEQAIQILGYDPRLQALTETYSGLGGSVIGVNRKPIVSVASVSLVDGSGYSYDPSTISHDGARQIFIRCGRVPRGSRNLSVTYTAGLSPVPSTIVVATLEILKAQWDARGIEFNATGESYDGVSSQTWLPGGASSVPPGARSKLMTFANTMVFT